MEPARHPFPVSSTAADYRRIKSESQEKYFWESCGFRLCTLSAARCTDWESRAESSRSPAALFLLSQARSFPPCIEWKKKVGFPLFGESPKTTAARNTTA